MLLWPETESSRRTGAILPIYGRVDRESAVVIQIEPEQTVIPAWRVAEFSDQDAAEAFAAEYEPWFDLYARSLRTALPVRERADRMSARVYRLRDGELMKVLSRSDEPGDEGGLKDYWYEVLTREGVTGWVFGYYLELTGSEGRSLNPQEQHDGTDRIVRDISGVSWRPAYFREMVGNGRIDLGQFSPAYGLFGDWENQQFQLVLPGFQREFSYEGYFSQDGRSFEFAGTDLEITLNGEDRLTAVYDANGRQRSTDFILFEEDIALIITAERERRSSLLTRFLDRGNGLISTAYGAMRITEQGAFTWSGYERLVPGVLSQTFNGSGRLDFDTYLSDELRGRYDGAISVIGTSTNNDRVRFLYSITDDGVRFVYVPPNLINNLNVIVSDPISPVVIFFRFVTE